jgi:hypothetical protein
LVTDATKLRRSSLSSAPLRRKGRKFSLATTPVMFSLGLLRFVTRPSWIGSKPVSKTIGIVVFAAFAASAVGFRFSENYRSEIEFSVVGDYRYEGFFLTGCLTPSGTMDARKNAPTPPLNASVLVSSGYLKHPVTRHAKFLRNVFVSDYGATDFRTMFGVR